MIIERGYYYLKIVNILVWNIKNIKEYSYRKDHLNNFYLLLNDDIEIKIESKYLQNLIKERMSVGGNTINVKLNNYDIFNAIVNTLHYLDINNNNPPFHKRANILDHLSI